jgi:hypothetical protein
MGLIGLIIVIEKFIKTSTQVDKRCSDRQSQMVE